jgi:hypothetical protein
MIRHSRERPFGELELLIKPLDETNSLEKSLQILRNDLSSHDLIEQYEVSLITRYAWTRAHRVRIYPTGSRSIMKLIFEGLPVFLTNKKQKDEIDDNFSEDNVTHYTLFL